MEVRVQGEKIQVEQGTTLKELGKRMQKENQPMIVLATVDDKLTELYEAVQNGSEIHFETMVDKVGNKTYKRGVTMLLLKSAYDTLGSEIASNLVVQCSISKGYYCKFKSDFRITEELLLQIKVRMHELVKKEVPIEKRTVSTKQAIELFGKQGMNDKVKLFKYRRVSKTNIYAIDDYEDYFYGYMVPDTGYLKFFDLYLYAQGFVLQMPDEIGYDLTPEFLPQNKLFHIIEESMAWGELMNVSTVGALNDSIAQGNIVDLIQVQEAIQEKKIGAIADEIIQMKKKIVLIAGPSSSGKTTFSHRLSIQLKTHGKKTYPIGIDNYYKDREQSPKDEDGKFNFEILEAIDVEKFNEDMLALLSGKTVCIPRFDFKLGKKVYENHFLKIGKDDILVIEGIHALNNQMTYAIDSEMKFKIYLSALTQLNIDEHNRIPTTDGRLLRRIVRDAKHRGTSAQGTIAMWNSVRQGEEQCIFPHQEQADVMFNSALIYELAVLKPYAESLLFAIPMDSDEYVEAKRMLKFLDYLLSINSEDVPTNSILREFIGGSCFRS